MPRIPPLIEQATWPTLRKLWQQLSRIINGGLSFGDGTNPDNLSVFFATVTPAVTNTDFVLNHNLGRIPAGYLAVEKSAACDVYTGSTPPTASQITLRSSNGGTTLRIMVF